ncbi:MAG: hypothetical protein V4621_05165 [Pseudomonadota bacterium]
MSKDLPVFIDIGAPPTPKVGPARTLFQALANPSPLRIAGHLQDPGTFSHPYLVNTETRGLTIKVSESPIILPPLYAHLAEAVAIMARNVADHGHLDYNTACARLYHSYKYLMKDQTNFLNGIHIDCGDITQAVSGPITPREIGIVSDIPCLTTQFFHTPIILDESHARALENETGNDIQNRIFEGISNKCEGVTPYTPAAHEVVMIDGATPHCARPNPHHKDYRRSILTVIFERDADRTVCKNAFLSAYLRGEKQFAAFYPSYKIN